MNQTIDFTIIRSRRRSLVIQITPGKEIIVKAPLLTPQFIIKRFVNDKRKWIEKQTAHMQKQKAKQYIEGEEFLYLGNIYKLHIGNYKHISIASGNKLNFPNFLMFRAEKTLTSWYIKQAKEIITERTKHYSNVMHAEYKNITFSDTKSKWGTCDPDNSLQFNWRLIMAPITVIDYVVVHELVHTWEKNHKQAFWTKVRLYKPAYKQYIKWLKYNQSRMVI